MNIFDAAMREKVFDAISAAFWSPIRVTSQDSPPVITEGTAHYGQPTNFKFQGTQSSDHQIEFRPADFPDMRPGQTVEFLDDDGNVISDQRYAVRANPYTEDDPFEARDGYYKHVLLTKL